MITIPKAIKDIQARIAGEFYIQGKDDFADLKMGIEAMKYIQYLREIGCPGIISQLPGESEE